MAIVGKILLAGVAAMIAAPAAAQLAAPRIVPSGRWTAHRAGAASTPPMGWSSWNAFRTEIDEAKVIGSAEALVRTGLARLGYAYVNIDDGWWLKRRLGDKRLEIRTTIFPSAQVSASETSFRPLVDRLHGMGLKAGIYTDIGRNACSQAWDLRSPNLPTGTVMEREVGIEGHVAQDLSLFFREWGFDYVKIDACGLADYTPGSRALNAYPYRPHEPLILRSDPARDQAELIRARYREVADVLARYNPDDDYVLSICTWGRGDVRSWGHRVGNVWRTSPDIDPHWSAMLRSYDSVVTRALYARPGAWNDPDMLFIGKGDFDAAHRTEARSHFALWAMLSAPLLIGYDLRNAPRSLLDIWGNADAVAVNQDRLGNQAVLVRRTQDVHVLVKSLSGGVKAVALFNRSDRPQTVSLSGTDLKFDAARPIALRDLWSKATLPVLHGSRQFTLGPHETLLLEARGSHVLGQGRYLSEMPARVHVAEDGVAFPEGRRDDATTAGEYALYARHGGTQADANAYGGPLASGGATYRSGLGTYAGSRIEVLNDREFRRFQASVGVDRASRDADARVRFLVYGDGRLLARTRPLARADGPVPLQADVRGVKVVEIIAQPESRVATPVAVSWGDARLNT